MLMNRFMIKRLAALLLAGSLAGTLLACGDAKRTTGAESRGTSEATALINEKQGGWELNLDDPSLERHADARAAFEKLSKSLKDARYEGIALLGRQVVAGTNYAILCRVRPAASSEGVRFELIYVYEDLEGAVQMTGKRILLEGGAIGAYMPNEGERALERHAEAKAAFDMALTGLAGVSYEPVAYLGSQSVAGTNYLALFRSKAAAPGAESEFVLLTVFVDAEGRVELGEAEKIELGAGAAASEQPGSVSIADPFTEFASLAEAEQAVGFEISLPEAPQDYAKRLYRVNSESRMLEVLFGDAQLGSENGKEVYRIRKAEGSDDISGVYEDYSERREIAAGEVQALVRGEAGRFFVATWTSGAYTYAIDADMDGAGLTEDEMIRLIEATK